MLQYLKYLVQLILSPSNGWEDISRENPDPDALMRRGLYPLLAISALTEFAALFYDKGVHLLVLVIRSIVDFGAYFVSIHIARLILGMYLPRLTDPRESASVRADYSLIVFAIGLMVLLRIIENCLQADLTFMKFVPLYVMLVIYKGARFLGVRQGCELRFLGLASLALVLIPLLIYNIISLILV